MPDPMHELDDFKNRGLPVNPLPPSEVRRRGDRMRRRNTALATVGGVAAAAVLIGTPVAVIAGTTGNAPSPGLAESPSVTVSETPRTTWLQQVPDRFPLAEGLPTGPSVEGGEVTAEPGTVDLSLCGATFWSVDAPVPSADVAGVTATADLEQLNGRTLAVYADEQAADEAYRAIRKALNTCEVDRTGTGFDQAYDVVERDLGAEQSFAFAQYSVEEGDNPVGDLTTWQVARTGNALYLASASSQGGANPQLVEDSLDRMAEGSAGVVSDLCVFAADPCPDPWQNDPPASAEAGDAARVPDGFAIEAGLRVDGDSEAIGPSADGDGVDLTAMCGTGSDTWPADPADRLTYAVAGPELLQTRELTTYPSTVEATEVLQGVRDAVSACSSAAEASSDRIAWTQLDAEVETGQDSVTFAMNRSDGSLGGMIYQLTRVGHAVLATSRSGESSTTTVAPGAVELTDTNTPVVEEMLAAFGD